MSERLIRFLASHWGITSPNMGICAACFGRNIARRARAPPRRRHPQDHRQAIIRV